MLLAWELREGLRVQELPSQHFLTVSFIVDSFASSLASLFNSHSAGEVFNIYLCSGCGLVSTNSSIWCVTCVTVTCFTTLNVLSSGSAPTFHRVEKFSLRLKGNCALAPCSPQSCEGTEDLIQPRTLSKGTLVWRPN